MKTLKKALALLLAVTMTIGLASCGKSRPQTAAIRTDAGLPGDEKDRTADLSRADKELIAELLGGRDGSDLSDDELDELVNGLVKKNEESGTSADASQHPGVYDEDGAMTKPFDEVYPELIENGKVKFSGESILIKLADGTLTRGLKAAGIGALEQIVPLEGAAWYEAKLTEGTDAKAALAAVRELREVLLAEYNYQIRVAALDDYRSFDEATAAQYMQNTSLKDQWYFHYCGIVDGFEILKRRGGDPSVVVAVIDSGVDYEHQDLKDNMWVNTGEIPGNGIDDDGNGYIDDYYGVDILTGKGNGGDTNGHGTHVAGIIAARHNHVGTLGIAYNVKIMSVKAAAHNGTLNQADIAKAVLYAYENGAEVINMSFGGSACSIAVQDALATAYTRCVLVASAGNDGLPNEPAPGWRGDVLPNYPAALSYVLGVMSVDRYGRESSFSNWDANKYNGIEYELYAPGESMISTLPNDRYGFLSGTSMAAPVVSAFAAILRSEFTDRDKYPTKFIYGQLAATSGYRPECIHKDVSHNVPQLTNLHDALTKLPKPELNVQGFAIFDDPALSDKNNGDGVIDAGETIALGLTLRNRWGMSEDTIVTIDTLSQAGIEDPYIQIKTGTVNYEGVGTYSTKDNGKIMTDGVHTGWEKPFVFTVADDCPNDYRITFNVNIRCKNGLDDKDKTTYTFDGKINSTVRSGCVLPSIIEEDMVLTKDSLYIIPRATVIKAGVTVRVEPGTHIQFWSDDPKDPYAEDGIAFLRVEGNFLVNGTKEEPVMIYPSELKSDYVVDFGEADNGYISLRYADVTNLNKNYFISRTRGISRAYGCTFRQNFATSMRYRYVSGGKTETASTDISLGTISLAQKCVFYKMGNVFSSSAAPLTGAADTCIFADCGIDLEKCSVRNCVFLGNLLTDQTNPRYSRASTAMPANVATTLASDTVRVHYHAASNIYYVEDRNTYFGVRDKTALLNYVRQLGGGYAMIKTKDELDWLCSTINGGGKTSSGIPYEAYDIGITYDAEREKYVMADGSDLPNFLQQKGVTDSCHGAKLYLYLTDGKLYNRYATNCYSLYGLGKSLPEKITFDRYQIPIDMDTTLQLHPQCTPVQLSPADFLYESSDKGVLTVDANGLVTPVAPGKADVWVTSVDRAVKNHVTVEVKDYVPLTGIAFTEKTVEVEVGETAALSCTLTPEDTTRRMLTYTVKDPSVAQMDENGVITGIGTGTTTVTAMSAELGADGRPITDTVTVTVYRQATSLAFENVALSLSVADGAADLPRAIGSAGAEPRLSYRSTDEAVATVDAENGRLIPHRAGTTALVATDERSGLTASCFVVVSEKGLVGVKDIQSIAYSYMALLDDGRLFYWDNSENNYSPRLIAENVRTMCWGMGTDMIYYALDDGALFEYSRNYHTKTVRFADQFTGKKIDRLSVYQGSYYAMTADGVVYAWGKNENGQLGLGSTEEVKEPTKVPLENVLDVSASYHTAFFLIENGQLYAAGEFNGKRNSTPVLLDEGVKSIGSSYGESCYYYTEDGQIKRYRTGEGTITVVSSFSGMETVAVGYYISGNEGSGIGIKDGRVYTINEYSWIKEIPMITDAKRVFYDYNNTRSTYYVATGNGLLYGFGNNRSNQIPGAPVVVIETPTLILLEPVAEESVTLSGTSLNGGVLTDDALVLSFNKAVVSAEPKLYGDGVQILAQSEVRNGVDLAIGRAAGFAEGVQYEAVFPAGSITAAFGVTNTEEIRVPFTYSAQGSADPAAPGEVIYPSETDPSIERVVTAESFAAGYADYMKTTRYNPAFFGNAILNPTATDTDVSHWLRPTGATVSSYTEIPIGGNWWGTTNEELIGRQIFDYADMPTYARLMYAPYLTAAPENTFPFVTGVTLLNKNGEAVTTVGNEKVTFRITFNRDMDTQIPLSVRFGSAYPYGDYEVEGRYADARTWEGVYTLNTLIENGLQYFTIANGRSATDDLDLMTDRRRFCFTIDTTAAQALIMQGTAEDTGVLLTWTQDDFATLMGYNVYRSTAKDGYYTRLNKTVIPADTMTWFDDTVEPGVVYYYNFTVVQTDMSESEPSGKIVIMSKDTMAPNIYHSPVANAFTGSNLILTATITDNLNIAYANLYYRIAGTDEWVIVRMNKLNDKYSAIIPAADLTAEGLEYYIEASDGVSSTFKGSAAQPFTVAVQESIGADALGDVNGDGVINNLDALMLLYAINDKCNLTAEQFARADLNGDGRLSAAEALRILQYVNGVVGSLKM